MNQVVLSLRNISYRYHKEVVLENINLDLHESQILGVLGPNGGGKSTLLKLIVGQLAPLSGNIEFHKHTKSCMAYLPQIASINKTLPLTCLELVELGRLKKHNHSITSPEEIIELVGLKEKINSLISELSGGEFQRAMLAKSLVSNPKLIILDEPCNGLDSQAQDQLYKVIKNLKEQYKTSLIIVDHNINEVIKHSDQIICLNKTLHWHNSKDLISKDIIENIYHCELEHLKIHQKPEIISHHKCDHSVIKKET